MNKTLKDGHLSDVESLYLEEEDLLFKSREWSDFSKSYRRFKKSAFNSLTFDTRFNAVHWGFSVGNLCREIAFSYCWMNAYAKRFLKTIKKDSQPSNVDFHVSYFADNAITRIDSCRDKIALMIWAFYCPFNPEKRSEVLDFHKVLERLKYPFQFGLVLRNHEAFITCLELLKGNEFGRIEMYRNYKVHRIEPSIELHGIESHHGWPYLFPLYDRKKTEEWEKSLQRQYPDRTFREGFFTRVEKYKTAFGTTRRSGKISKNVSSI
jgi:hypothetical protein